MKAQHLFASLFIVACTAVAWFILGTALNKRTQTSARDMRNEVSGVWGPPIHQLHPHAWYETQNTPSGRAIAQPSSSLIAVTLDYTPKRRGLIWHRTYNATIDATYTFTNPTKIPQTFYINFPLPRDTTGLHHFTCTLGNDEQSHVSPNASGTVTQAVVLPASGSIALHALYRARGTGTWTYGFPDNRRISNFKLAMHTDFQEINFPTGTGSPSTGNPSGEGYVLTWDYPDVLQAPNIGMDMPAKLNAGPVASRIAFFAPVSLLFFVTILLLVGGMRGVAIHPMHIFFVSAGFFAFHLLFAYLVDLLPLWASFAIASLTSTALVCAYLRAVGGNALFKVALPAQLIYLIFFSASFFIDGLTGITLTVLSVLTLGLLMFATAKFDWREFFKPSPFKKAAMPPPLVGQRGQ